MGVALLTESVDRNNAKYGTTYTSEEVALLTESVDRNLRYECERGARGVALLTESVDRNFPTCGNGIQQGLVALLTESVDRNNIANPILRELGVVALLTESVDRNSYNDLSQVRKMRSLSSRRAWIEIKCAVLFLSKADSRSPHGERG